MADDDPLPDERKITPTAVPSGSADPASAAGTGHDAIAELYQGEVFGEALFNRMLRDVRAAHDQHVIGTLLQYESETKVYLRQAAAARGLSIVEDEGQRAAAHETASSLGAMSWRDKMRRLRMGIADHYLPRYRLLDAEAHPEDRDVTSFMVRHELALLEVVVREERGEHETSLDPLAPYLRCPLPRPLHGA